MQRKVFFFLIIFTFLFSNSVFASSLAANYLIDLGASYYEQGKFEEALDEFSRVLQADPGNQTAKKYINDIFSKQGIAAQNAVNESFAQAQEEVSTSYNYEAQTPARAPDAGKIQAMNQALDQMQGEDNTPVVPPPVKAAENKNKEERGIKAGPAVLTGDIQLAMGTTPDAFIWKRANFDLNEKFKSWRMTSDAVFNRRFNTYDPSIYDSLSLNVDTKNETGFNFHSNITVDPWSFTGKTDKFTVTSTDGLDSTQLQMYYWSNTGYILNQTAYTSTLGDTFSIPEVKVVNGTTTPFTSTSFRNSKTFEVGSQKVYREFQPVRELWMDYANDNVKLRTFALGYQDQAYTSDDPMTITNHGIWWKDSKWLRQYTPGIRNTSDFEKGRWDDSLSFVTKDSTGKYLTGLRGFAFNFQTDEKLYFDTTVATPKHLWQDYASVDNVISASRLKYFLDDNLMIGGTVTTRFGFLTEQSNDLDSRNVVGGMDLGYQPAEGVKFLAEALASKSDYDMTNKTFKTDANGGAYYFSIISRYPSRDIMNLKYGYEEIAREKDDPLMVKTRFFASWMDPNFDSALSDYHNTRQDVFWSRHIHFRKQLDYYSEGLYGDTTNWGGLNATRIGDGIDAGRSVIAFRAEAYLDSLYNLFDVRNVHSTKGKFIENVVRDEATIKINDKLTAKALGIYQKLPPTVTGVDPFVYDGNTGEFFINSAVKGGEDPSIKTGSFGLNYEFFDWLSLNGVYEYTNDYTLAYGDFPRNVLRNDTTLYSTYWQDGNLYRALQPFLYSQNNFPQAPYDYYNVFKSGLRLRMRDDLEAYLDYTRNMYEAASLVSDSMNHVGLELAYTPTKRMGFVFKYTFSRAQDINELINGNTKLYSYHNFFSEFRYKPSKEDELVMSYGVGDTSGIGNLASLDPYGGGLLTLETQHIIRAYYRKRF